MRRCEIRLFPPRPNHQTFYRIKVDDLADGLSLSQPTSLQRLPLGLCGCRRFHFNRVSLRLDGPCLHSCATTASALALVFTKGELLDTPETSRLGRQLHLAYKTLAEELLSSATSLSVLRILYISCQPGQFWSHDRARGRPECIAEAARAPLLTETSLPRHMTNA